LVHLAGAVVSAACPRLSSPRSSTYKYEVTTCPFLDYCFTSIFFAFSLTDPPIHGRVAPSSITPAVEIEGELNPMFLIPCMNKVRRDFPHHFLPLIGVLSLCITRLQTPLILLHGTCGDDQEERQQTATASPSSCLHAQAITPSSSTWTRRVRRAGPR
jgi:hypothetical protein